jgi:hypothetical protein
MRTERTSSEGHFRGPRERAHAPRVLEKVEVGRVATGRGGSEIDEAAKVLVKVTRSWQGVVAMHERGDRSGLAERRSFGSCRASTRRLPRVVWGNWALLVGGVE